MNVLSQLRNRRIVQIVFSYLAAGWALLEVADQLTTRGLAPNFVYTIVLVWFVAGIPAAMMIGWHHGEKGKQTAPRSELAMLLALALIALAGSGFAVREDVSARRARAAAEHPLEMRKVAVMYFRDLTNDTDLAYLADGLTEDLIGALRSVNELDVMSGNATARFRDSDVPLDSIALELGVGTVVDGTVEKRGDMITVSLQLIDGQSGTVVERTKVQRPAAELLAMRDSVVTHAANLLRQWIGKEVRLRNSERGTAVKEAWALVQRAEKLRKEAEAAVRKDGPVAGEAGFRRAIEHLSSAQALDPKWVEPRVQTTAITYRRARLAAAAGDVNGALQFITEGLKHAEDALGISAREPRALELRGTLRYFKWLLNATPDAREREQLRADARKDLETAIGLDASLAGAHNTLSHLLYNEDTASALVEARLAYEADAYLEVAGDVVWRLFYGNFDLENFTQSMEWCRTGAQRFADDYRFAYCKLRLMASPGLEPDVKEAWRLAARIDSLAPAPKKAFEQARALMAVGGVLARTQQGDSARAVLLRARNLVTVDIDPGYDLLFFEAHMRLLLGEKDVAFDLLRRGVLANPDQAHPRGRPLPWMYRELQSHARVGDLYARGS